jgi:hypothetical protein
MNEERERARLDTLIYYLLAETNLQRQHIARILRVDPGLVTRIAAGGFKETRRATDLTEEELQSLREFDEVLEEVLDEDYPRTKTPIKF